MSPHPDPKMVAAKDSPKPSPMSTPTPERTGTGHSEARSIQPPTESVGSGPSGDYETPGLRSNVKDTLPYPVNKTGNGLTPEGV